MYKWQTKIMIKYSIVIPIYKSEDCLEELLRQLTKVFSSSKKVYEIILVNDASPDNSWEIIKDLTGKYEQISAITMMRNVGQARAILCGLSYATGEIIITMDDDLQHRPDQLSILIEKLESTPELDCVFGCYKKKKHSGYRNFGSKVIKWINAKAFGLPNNIEASSLRIMRLSLVKAILQNTTQSPSITALIYQNSHNVISIPIEHSDRFAGVSNYTLSKQFKLAFDNICNVSTLPLKIVSLLGFVFCIIAILLSLIIFIRYTFGQIKVPGWTTVVVLISFFSGIILLSLGIQGEYLVRILQEVKGGTLYTPRKIIGKIANEK